MTSKKVWAIGALAFLVGAGATFAVTIVADDHPKVMVQPEFPTTADMPQTREGLIAAWTPN
ncbi:hypothetical protein ACFZAV_21740 [Streptomyces sp. NPDC008343]|uniref:hypothetical protein n=1 Tax=Streptomyces sp. NPDC008343 TaxID=3364828 RepID=UPI0036E17467